MRKPFFSPRHWLLIQSQFEYLRKEYKFWDRYCQLYKDLDEAVLRDMEEQDKYNK